MVFYQVFLLSPLQCTCVNLKKYKSQGKAVEVNVNSKEEHSLNFCLDFVQESGHCTVHCTHETIQQQQRQYFKVPIVQIIPEAKFLDAIGIKVLRVFLLAIHSHCKQCTKKLKSKTFKIMPRNLHEIVCS